MPKIPTPSNGSAGSDPTANSNGAAAESQADIDAAQVARYRDAAISLGMDYDNIPLDQRDFIHVFAEGGLDSLEPGADPENPLIPLDTENDGATPSTDVDGAGVGPGLDASGADAGAGDDVALDESPVVPAPVSAIPPTVPPLPDAVAEQTITLADGSVVSASQLQAWIEQQQQSSLSQEEIAYINARRQGLVAPQFVDPQTGLPVSQSQPQPQQAPTEWVDTEAQAAYAQIQGQLAQLTASQRQIAEATLAQQNIALAQGMQAGIDLFKQERGLDDATTERLLTSVNMLGILPVYAKQYPGDPRSAIAASLDAVYWNTPENREAEIQRRLAEEIEANRSADVKKAGGGALASSGGSVPRSTPAPNTREERTSGMVQMIEAAQRGE